MNLAALLLDWRVWLGLAFAALGAAVAIQTARLHGCEDRLDAAQQRVAGLEDRLRQQAEGVNRLKAASDAKIADASRSLQKARSEALAAQGESARLRLLASQQRKPDAPRPANCPPSGADRAVDEIRRGL